MITFSCIPRLSIGDCSFEGVGATKTDAKMNAAANAIEELGNDERFFQLQSQVNRFNDEQRRTRKFDLKPVYEIASKS